MQSVLNQLAILYLFLAVGWIIGRVKPGQTEHSGILSVLLVNFFLPCKVFSNFSSNFTPAYLISNGVAVLFAMALLGALVLLSIPLARLLTKDEYEQRIYRYTFTVSNYAYVGYGLTEGVFGEAVLTDLILFCIPFAIYTYSFGYALLTGGKKPWKRLINPVTVGIALGCVSGLSGIALPSVPQSVVSGASACFGPVSMLLTGLTLSTLRFKELFTDKVAYLVCAIRLIGIPGLILGLCLGLRALGILPPAVYPAALIMAAMPTGLNTVVFPKMIGKDCTIGARLAFLSHLLSLATLPLMLALVS